MTTIPELVAADICVIGGGAAGLSVAAGAVQMGARTVLVEANRMGGDCLNTGCVPSKALLAAAHAAHAARAASRLGVDIGSLTIDYDQVRAHVHSAIAAIAPNDSQERFERLACRVVRAHASFVDRATLAAGELQIKARRFVIATGSRAAIPPIPGLDTIPFLTNENIFDLPELPEHLVVVGAGPVGCELAQAFRRLGARVSLIDIGPMLPKDDEQAVSVVRQSLLEDGVELHEKTGVVRVGGTDREIEVELAGGISITGSHLLVAAGRRPNLERLGLEAANIAHDARGILVDRRLRTSNRRVFAIGDVAGGLQFTHLAGYHAGVVIKNALFHLPAKVALDAFPWVTYTSPELAQVGMNESEARTEHGGKVRILTAPFGENDRAITERDTAGFVKIIAGANGRLLGATIVGPQAGELIHLWAFAIAQRAKVGEIASMIAPYPTLGECGKKAASSFFTPTLFGARVKRIVRWLAVLP